MKKEEKNRCIRGEKARKTGIGGEINGNSSRFSPDLSEKPVYFDKKPARFWENIGMNCAGHRHKMPFLSGKMIEKPAFPPCF